MPFGKYKGQYIDGLESSYLCWCLENIEHLKPELKSAMFGELQRRYAPPPALPTPRRYQCPDLVVAMQIVETGRRHLAKKYHPDTGGTTALMQSLNATTYWLQGQITACSV